MCESNTQIACLSQDMVPKATIADLAAGHTADARRADMLAEQLAQAQKQAASAQAAMADMVPRSELAATEALVGELEGLMRAGEVRSRAAAENLRARALACRRETEELRAAMQANGVGGRRVPRYSAHSL